MSGKKIINGLQEAIAHAMTPTPEEVAALVQRLLEREELSVDRDGLVAYRRIPMCEQAAAALTALQARAEAAEARVRELEADLQNATDEANACGAERAAWKDRADQKHEALAELVEEVDFFLRLFKSGKPVYGDRMKDSADHARAALTPASDTPEVHHE